MEAVQPQSTFDRLLEEAAQEHFGIAEAMTQQPPEPDSEAPTPGQEFREQVDSLVCVHGGKFNLLDTVEEELNGYDSAMADGAYSQAQEHLDSALDEIQKAIKSARKRGVINDTPMFARWDKINVWAVGRKNLWQRRGEGETTDEVMHKEDMSRLAYKINQFTAALHRLEKEIKPLVEQATLFDPVEEPSEEKAAA